MKNEQKQEIHLRDMCYQVLSAWRLLAVVTLVVALVLCGGKYAMDLARYSSGDGAQASQQVVTRQDLEDQLTSPQLLTVREAENMRELVDEKQEYVEHSLYIAINPYETHSIALSYYVDAGTALDLGNGVVLGDGGEMAKAYVNYIDTVMFSDQSESPDARYEREVVDAALVTDSAHQFVVTVKGDSKEAVTRLAEKVKPQIADVTNGLVKTLGAHSIQLVNEAYAVSVDQDVLDDKEAFYTTYNNLCKNLATLETGLNAAQLKLYQFDEEAQQDVQAAAPQKPVPSLKYAVLGGGVGFCCAALWVAFLYMGGSRLRKAEELFEVYQVDVLGTLPTKKGKRKFAFVDRLIERLFTREQWTKEQRMDFTVSHLQMVAEKAEVNRLVFMTNLKLNKQEKALVDEVVARLQKKGVSVVLGEQIHRDIDVY